MDLFCFFPPRFEYHPIKLNVVLAQHHESTPIEEYTGGHLYQIWLKAGKPLSILNSYEFRCMVEFHELLSEQGIQVNDFSYDEKTKSLIHYKKNIRHPVTNRIPMIEYWEWGEDDLPF